MNKISFISTEFVSTTNEFANTANSSMAPTDMTKKIDKISTELWKFGRKVITKKFSDILIEQSYKTIVAEFNKSMEKIAAIKNQLHGNNNYELISATLEAEDNLNESFRTMTNKFLSYRPTVNIEYGAPCIEKVITQSQEEKICNLLKKFKGLRKIRGDGNCFLSSFITRILENYIQENKLSVLINFVERNDFKESPLQKTELFSQMLPLLKTEILKVLNALSNDPSQLENILKDNKKILPLIKYLRIVAADELITKIEQFEWSLRSDIKDIFQGNEEQKSYVDLISEYVLQMGKDFSHPAIVALCQRLEFCVNIMDPRVGAENGLNILEDQTPKATFCHDEAHYFVLYTEEQMKEIQFQPTAAISNNNNSNPLAEFYIECKLPLGSNLYVRGLESWDVGIELKNSGNNIWMFESSQLNGECKFLINDNTNYWEKLAGNRKIEDGKLVNGEAPQFESLPLNYEIYKISISCNLDENTHLLGICGEGIDGVGDWDKNNPITLTKTNGLWNTEIQKKSESNEIAFKYVRINKQNDQIDAWEDRGNRSLNDKLPPKFN